MANSTGPGRLCSVYPVLFMVILCIFTDKIHLDTETEIFSALYPFRVVLKVNPKAVRSILERVTAEEEEEEADGHSQEEEEEEGAAHSLKDVCDFGKPEPSPFSSRRVMYENEEVWRFLVSL